MTQERMHPQDLRAIMAALHGAAEFHMSGSINPIAWADNLLEELERTAKPDPGCPTYTMCTACGANALKGAPLVHTQGCPMAPGATDVPHNPSQSGDPGAESGWIARITQARHEARADGAREERERLCRLFTTGQFSIRMFLPSSRESVSLTYETALGYALEPKP